MGAMFLYKTNADIEINGAKDEFSKKGFSEGRTFNLGKWCLLLYKKHAEQELNFIENNDAFICMIGAAMYKNTNKTEVLKTVLNDFLNNELEISEFRGHFNIIIYHNEKLTVITDSLISKKIFCDDLHTMYSSSMLAVIAARKGKITVNKMAVYEKMMTGIIVSPDTYFNEIKALSRCEMKHASEINKDLSFVLPANTDKTNILYEKDFDKCVNQQITELDNYFERLSHYSGNSQIDTGLSGGYDSRLVFAMLIKHLNKQVHIHTHDTKNVHGGEKKIALQLSQKSGKKCNTVTTHQLNECDNLEKLMEDNLHYFDGRSSFVIGGFNETYTSDYRCRATENSKVTLSGMGGEVYRNYYHVTNRNIPFKKFFEKSIIIPEFKMSLKDKSIFKEVCDLSLKKSGSILNVDLADAKGIIYTRRYYSEVMMSEGQGTVIDTYNQVSDFFVPFIEDTVLGCAYKNTKLLGSNGCFEAAMINKVNPELAKIPSTYGHAFDKIPLSFILKQNIRFMVKPQIWAGLSRIIHGNVKKEDTLRKTLEQNRVFTDAFDLFKRIFPEIDFEILLNGRYEFKNISMIVFLFYTFRDKLKLD